MLRWFHLIVHLIMRRVEAGSLAAEPCSFCANCENPSEPGWAGLPSVRVYLGAGYHFHRPMEGDVILPHSTQLGFIMSQTCGTLSCLGCRLIKRPASQK